jgi:hypothetical protein
MCSHWHGAPIGLQTPHGAPKRRMTHQTTAAAEGEGAITGSGWLQLSCSARRSDRVGMATAGSWLAHCGFGNHCTVCMEARLGSAGLVGRMPT